DRGNYQLVTDDFRKANGYWYYFNAGSGSIAQGLTWVPQRNTWNFYDQGTYQLVTNDYRQANGYSYYFKKDGSIASGWTYLNNDLVYFDPQSYQKKVQLSDFGSLNSTQSDFLMSVIPGALAGWEQYGVLPSVTIAQAILESAWGQSLLATEAHNLFGIKGSYNGNSVTMPTQEEYGGQYVTINAAFRAYANNSESIQDHGAFLYYNSRYNNLLGDSNYVSVANKLRNDGYATASTYATSLINLVQIYGLDILDK
ncbi:mannosyl-glycoprotein endo-beta-N-acetylglucosamidase, partial [Lactobacillus rossiae]|nr:mannosyl-glycoprotein endo-beta-N-acetylglucosamidase [Furfurilactobacillus milii]